MQRQRDRSVIGPRDGAVVGLLPACRPLLPLVSPAVDVLGQLFLVPLLQLQYLLHLSAEEK